MARKGIPQQPQSVVLSADQMRAGIARLEKRIVDLEALDTTKLQKRWAPEVKAIETAIDETLSGIYGHGTPEYRRYARAASLDNGAVTMSYDGHTRDNSREAQQYVAEGKHEASVLLKQAIRGLKEQLEELGSASAQVTVSSRASGPVVAHNRRVFVVHGHDEAAREAVARFLEKIDLEPIILHEQVSRNKTIIEKIEEYSDVGFAVVIMTPDDLGKAAESDEPQPRARQNVIFELGYFIGRLGRARVCALRKGEPEVLSDFSGVVYTTMDVGGAWKVALAKEIDAAGIEIDFNKAVRS